MNTISYIYISVLFDSLFHSLPQSKVLFGFPIDLDTEAMAGSKRFLMHSTFLVNMIEKALNMLGTDDDELTILMSDLGRKHVIYGVSDSHMRSTRGLSLQIYLSTCCCCCCCFQQVKADYFPHMKNAIMAMLHEMLEIKFDARDEDAWDEVLSVLISDMTKAQREVAMKKEVDKHKNRK